MSGTRDNGSGEATRDILLEGGPTDIPQTARRQRVAPGERRLKLLHRGGYEHFELPGEAPEHPAHGQAVFHWTMRTRIAE